MEKHDLKAELDDAGSIIKKQVQKIGPALQKGYAEVKRTALFKQFSPDYNPENKKRYDAWQAALKEKKYGKSDTSP
jgi:hypothetical protein